MPSVGVIVYGIVHQTRTGSYSKDTIRSSIYRVGVIGSHYDWGNDGMDRDTRLSRVPLGQ